MRYALILFYVQDKVRCG